MRKWPFGRKIWLFRGGVALLPSPRGSLLTVRSRSASVRAQDLRELLRKFAQERPRFAYRRLFTLINWIYRLHRAMREPRARRKAIGTRATKSNARWSLGFVHDQLDN